MEEWKEVNNYEGLYWISNLGHVKNSKGKILKPTVQVNGYYKVNLIKNKISKNHTIHRLVAEAFIPNPDKLPEVNHKDENKLNNSVHNLEWCSHKYNSTYGTILTRIQENSVNCVSVKCVETGIIYKSIREAGKITNIDHSNIAKVCRGKQKTAGGYHWVYV